MGHYEQLTGLESATVSPLASKKPAFILTGHALRVKTGSTMACIIHVVDFSDHYIIPEDCLYWPPPSASI